MITATKHKNMKTHNVSLFPYTYVTRETPIFSTYLQGGHPFAHSAIPPRFVKNHL